MENIVTYRAEYLWIDGTEPTAEIRSKTKILADGDEPGIWGYDGSSTNQATGDNSDVVLKPVFFNVPTQFAVVTTYLLCVKHS